MHSVSKMLCVLLLFTDVFSYTFPKALIRNQNHSKLVNTKPMDVKVKQMSSNILTALSQHVDSALPSSVSMSLEINPKRKVDMKAILNYIAATTVQWNLIYFFLKVVDSQVLPGLKEVTVNGVKVSNIVTGKLGCLQC